MEGSEQDYNQLVIFALAIALSEQIGTGLPENWAVPDWMTAESVARSSLAICKVSPPPTHPQTRLEFGAWWLTWGSWQVVVVDAANGDVPDLTWLPSSGTYSRKLTPNASDVASVRAIALAFGMPKDATVKLVSEGHVQFHWLPRGHKFPAPCFGDYFLDADGRLMRLQQSWRMSIDADRQSISLSSAVQLARPYYLSYMRDYSFPTSPVDMNASGLGYVADKRHNHLRLAWIVSFGLRNVRVDAGSGRILGIGPDYVL